MKVIINNILPPSGFKAINLFGIIFARKELDSKDKNHEAIHTAQMKEMFYIFFYIWYVIEWFIKLLKYGNSREAYRNIKFEREAYDNQWDMNYLNNRNYYAWLDK